MRIRDLLNRDTVYNKKANTRDRQYQIRWRKERVATRRALAIKIFGGKCIHCGTTENLEFDHVDPKTKIRPISRAFGCSEKIWLEELAKCQLLCRSCHQRKTNTNSKT